MENLKGCTMRQSFFFLFVVLMFSGCGSGENTGSNETASSKYNIEYKGLSFYAQDMPQSSYALTPLSEEEFDGLSEQNKWLVSDKLLATLFFGMTKQQLQQHFDAKDFLTSVEKGLQVYETDRAALETHLLDNDVFYIRTANEQEAVTILTRFYAMKKLDRYFFINWCAYILSQTIMFSPSYELESSHSPNIARVYNRLVTLLDDNASMAYVTFAHMSSDDNWRRFRSPEDNGREMLEIFTSDRNDTHVPIAAKALQNWSLNRDNDTLVIGLNENTKPLQLFGTTIYNGEDFYRELVKSPEFYKTAVNRVVRFFFTDSAPAQISSISAQILKSNPKTWQDILKQIVFSREYLLNASRAKSAEELFFSIAKKTSFKHRRGNFHSFKDSLENMSQASMKYKLGKLTRVPLDTLSFAYYHKFFREQILLRHSDENVDNNYSAWNRQGWSDAFLANDNFTYDYTDELGSLKSFINYLFMQLVDRDATDDEMAMFVKHFRYTNNNNQELFYSYFDIFASVTSRESNKRNIAFVVLDYISRLDEFYWYKGVNND